jgi:hypothetical protein
MAEGSRLARLGQEAAYPFAVAGMVGAQSNDPHARTLVLAYVGRDSLA